MRHFLQLQRPPLAVGRLAQGVQQPAPRGLLVALPRLTTAALPGRKAALATAVALAAVAPRADIRHHAAQVAEETPAIGAQIQTSGAWTPAPKPAMMGSPGASAPGLQGGGRSLATDDWPSPAFSFPHPFSQESPTPEGRLTRHRPRPRARDDDAASGRWGRTPESQNPALLNSRLHPHHTVTVVVRRGLVAVVQNLPPGYGYEVIDLDECP